MSTRRDYVPSREKNLAARMKEGASLQDGLAGKVIAQKDGARYRTYRDADGTQHPEKKYQGSNGEMCWGSGSEDDS